MRDNLLDVLAGARRADLVVTNGRIVDVHRREVRDGDVAAKSGRIVAVGDVRDLVGSATEVIDAGGRT